MKSLAIILLSVVIFFLTACNNTTGPKGDPPDTADILTKLQSLSDLEVREIVPVNGYPRQFEIDISQPLDHANPVGTRFKQRLYLSHVDESAPMVFMPTGYIATPNRMSELGPALGANQIVVAHRFMDGARPDPVNWQYLTIDQAAADHHYIVDKFKSIYDGKWISYGGSKNGMTALFHRRFYPDDVIATVALVAPISLTIDDPRYDTFLENVGTEDTRLKIRQFQRAVLKKRDLILPMIQNFMDNSTLPFSRFDAGAILEFEVAEYAFSFWQVTPGDPTSIPDSSASAQELYQHIEDGGYLPYYSDPYVTFYEPVYYQAYTELGWYKLVVDHLQDLLVTYKQPSYSYMAPRNVPLNFDPQVMPDILQWLQTEGNNIIYIYGGNDPWTAGAVELTGQTNAVKIVQPGANHYINIADLEERDLVYTTLSQWLDMEIPTISPFIASPIMPYKPLDMVLFNVP